MIRQIIKILMGLIYSIGLLMLVACGGKNIFRDRIDDYKTVVECPSLKIPKGIAAEPRSDDYCIAETEQTVT